MEDNITQTKKHSVYLNNRKEVIVEGVIKLDSFDKNEFLVGTTKGYLHLRGKDLCLGNLDLEKGILSIIGDVQSLTYIDHQNKDTKEGFWKKLFK